MVQETILQHWIVVKFILPFFLMFVLVYAILTKTKVLGEEKQVNAILAFVIGLIFVGVAYPKDVVGNMILFLTVALVVVFVALILWGFVSGQNMKEGILSSKLKWVVGIVGLVIIIIAVLWATGVENSVFDFFFRQTWSESFWINFSFVAMVAIALAVILRSAK